MAVIAATAVGCRAGHERKANALFSEAMAALDQAKAVMSAVEGGDLNAAPLGTWMHLAEAYDLMTEIGERFPDTHIAAALARSDSVDQVSPATSGSDSASARERIHGLALGFLALAINEDTEVDAWRDMCPRAPSDAWALVCVTGWVLSETPQEPLGGPMPELDLSALVLQGHGRNALGFVLRLEAEEIRSVALSNLAGALAWTNEPELALEALDTLAELGGSWAMAREEVVRAQVTLGDIEGVLATLDHLGPGVVTTRTRSAVAEALASLDDTVDRRRVLDRVLPFISSRARDEFLGSTAVAVAQTGSIQAALEIADRIADPDVIEMGRVLAEVAGAQAVAGDRAGALRALRPATDMVASFQSTSRYEQIRRASALGVLAGAWIRAGDRETGLALASEVSSRDSLEILAPIARALSAEGDLAEALEIAASLVESTELASDRGELGFLAPYVARRTFVDLVRDRIGAGDLAGALAAADRLGPDFYMGGRAFIQVVTEQTRQGDHAGALGTALRLPADEQAHHAIEALTIVGLGYPESDDVRNAINGLPATANSVALAMAYAALRDWRRALSLAADLEEWERQATRRCILRMFGSPRDLGCLQQTDI